MSSEPPEFLSNLLFSERSRTDRPHVTLTFAQSIDAKIGISDGAQLMLSCEESSMMTHWMRTMHDAILVGIGTALNDDPQLNVRKLPPPEAGKPLRHLPRPVILDKNLKSLVTCKLLRNFQDGTGRRPWIVYSEDGLLSPEEKLQLDRRKQKLEAAGAHIIPTNVSADGQISLSSLLQVLYANGVKSLMVEGGARVIQSFLSSSDIDMIIVTIAPMFVGSKGIGYAEFNLGASYRSIYTTALGSDTVVVLRPIKSMK